MKHFLYCVVKTIFFVTFLASSVRGEDRVDYRRDIKPLLKARCYACHGALEQESGLRLDTGAFIRKGGDSGSAVVPGKPQQSLLIQRISATSPHDRMPPEGEPLSGRQIEMIRQWISLGATSPSKESPEQDPRDHWAFQKPVRPRVPVGKAHDVIANPIDAFIDQALRKQNVLPQPLATKPILLRRVYLDLIGLPPTPDELHAFLADASPDAYERVVDRLLHSPRYGERWGRHWMDVWRYSDWYGRRHVPDVWNSAPQIWRWRDWIVRSLNQDHGYDRMVQEMLAADEISPADYEAGHATGYLIRNWYALNPNDWMRNTVEHTGKAFLGLTFNCAHCHDHKYDPIAQDDYFRFRAFFEPIGIRQDRVPGEADPGPFQEYEYSKLRKIQRLGAVRIFDQHPQAPTWFYAGGDERNRIKDRGPIPPGLPKFLSEGVPEIETVNLPPVAWYPGLRPGICDALLAEAQQDLAQAEAKYAELRETKTGPTPAVLERVRTAEAEYHEALRQAQQAGQPGALVGRQSLLLDATTGRRVVQNGLQKLDRLEDGSTLEFELMILKEAHVNFQLAKDREKGLTAGYVGFDQGQILSYRPGTFSEFEVGRYNLADGQNRFHVSLTIQTQADRCLLSVQSVADAKPLVENLPVALNSWQPVGDPTKAITFDARTGSVAVIDHIALYAPGVKRGKESGTEKPLLLWDFEPPVYSIGQDVIGIEGWLASSYSQAPATSLISQTAGNEALQKEREKWEAAQRAMQIASLPEEAAKAQQEAARAKLAALQARIKADAARYLDNPRDADPLIQEAARLEQKAAVRQAQADVLAGELAFHQAKAQPQEAANRQQKMEAVTKQLAAARLALEKARTASNDPSKPITYAPLSPQYPRTSTGRRRALALWITRRDNPLTARVAVNHIWMRHFHQPLVSSVYDFGRNGAPPTHPELLDWLAVEFMESGWSMKHLHKLIVTSAAYRRVSSAKGARQSLAIDPENRLLWRVNSGRMQAEIVRDSLLFCGGVLESTMGGQELENTEALTTHRRSLYYSVHPEQGGKNPLGSLFDAPDALECYRRTRSIVPQQALALTNSDLIHAMSARLVTETSGITDRNEWITVLFERILSRRPSDQELHVCREALTEQARLARKTDTSESQADTKARQSLVRALFNHNDFITIR